MGHHLVRMLILSCFCAGTFLASSSHSGLVFQILCDLLPVGSLHDWSCNPEAVNLDAAGGWLEQVWKRLRRRSSRCAGIFSMSENGLTNGTSSAAACPQKSRSAQHWLNREKRQRSNRKDRVPHLDESVSFLIDLYIIIPYSMPWSV